MQAYSVSDRAVRKARRIVAVTEDCHIYEHTFGRVYPVSAATATPELGALAEALAAFVAEKE